MLTNKVTDRRKWLAISGAVALSAASTCGEVVVAQAEPTSEVVEAKSKSEPTSTAERHFNVESLRGQVVWYAEALRERLGIQTVPEAQQRVLALATNDGQLIPIIEDLRGRAFRKDPRLREMEVELMVRRYEATPSVQILRVYQWKDGQKFQVDYWCDVCAIVMFEDGPCSCCQQHNRLRLRPVDP